jgi:Integral membrane protein (intg_mem_TP0381)
VFLVVGLGITPRPGAARKVFAITAAFAAAVGSFDAATGSNYMFLRSRPSAWSLLSVMGSWPWYIVSAAGLAIVLLTVLDAPFWRGRRLAVADSRDAMRVPGVAEVAPGQGSAEATAVPERCVRLRDVPVEEAIPVGLLSLIGRHLSHRRLAWPHTPTRIG